MISYFFRAYNVLVEAWSAPRSKKNKKINIQFSNYFKTLRTKKAGLIKYINKYHGLSEIKPINNWSYDKKLKEFKHEYSSSFFSNGIIRIKKFNTKKVLIYFSGYYSNSDDVLNNSSHPQYLTKVCKDLNVSLVTWNMISQGQRGQNSLYLNMNSTVSVEREYSRFLPTIGTSLWNENLNEIKYAVKIVNKFFENKAEIISAGWSMGGAYAHLVPLFTNNCKLVISTGSLARFHDLIKDGNTRLHGYFFYPYNGLKYFDLEDIVRVNIKKNNKSIFIFGDEDPGCLKTSYNFMSKLFKSHKKNVIFIKLKNYGHFFEPKIKLEIFKNIKKHLKNF